MLAFIAIGVFWVGLIVAAVVNVLSKIERAIHDNTEALLITHDDYYKGYHDGL